MIRHLLKLVWRRKRSSALLILEVAVSFVVVFAVAAVALYFAACYRRPLGFDWRDVFAVSFATGSAEDEPWDAAKAAALARLVREGVAMDGVAAIAAAWSAPYDGSTTIGMWEEEGRRLEAEMIAVTDAFREVLRLDIVRGRWFEESDSALAWQPVVVDEETARTLFGDEDPIGRSLPRDKGEPESRIVGVVHDFRKAGEFSAPRNFFFRRLDLAKMSDFPPRLIVVRAPQGAGTEFEERLVRRFRAVEPAWTFDARALEQSREMAFRSVLTPLAVGAVIAGFLLLMVSLGLIGVLWQNVTRRTREIGLRRALGAAGADVQIQILSELLIATLAGVVLGAVVVVQVPLLNLFASVSAGVYAMALLVSAAAIGAITLAAGLYPSWLATRVQPADALREE